MSATGLQEYLRRQKEKAAAAEDELSDPVNEQGKPTDQVSEAVKEEQAPNLGVGLEEEAKVEDKADLIHAGGAPEQVSRLQQSAQSEPEIQKAVVEMSRATLTEPQPTKERNEPRIQKQEVDPPVMAEPEQPKPTSILAALNRERRLASEQPSDQPSKPVAETEKNEDSSAAQAEEVASAPEPRMVSLLFKVPQEEISDITLTYSLEEITSGSISVGHLKERIQREHPLKPDAKRLRILFVGNLLHSKQKVKEVLETMLGKALANHEEKLAFTFHLMMFNQQKLLDQLNIGEQQQQPLPGRDAAQPGAQPEAGEQQQAPPPQPLTTDQIYMSKKYKKFEKALLQEYMESLGEVTGSKQLSFDAESKALDPGSHNLHDSSQVLLSQLTGGAGMNTNLAPGSNFALNHLPLMHKSFQSRFSNLVEERNLAINGEDSKGNLRHNPMNVENVRLLNYDSLLQFGLLGKLIVFMVLFGLRLDEPYRFYCWILVLSLYFYNVREAYISHYSRQRRLVNVNVLEENIQRINQAGDRGGIQNLQNIANLMEYFQHHDNEVQINVDTVINQDENDPESNLIETMRAQLNIQIHFTAALQPLLHYSQQTITAMLPDYLFPLWRDNGPEEDEDDTASEALYRQNELVLRPEPTAREAFAENMGIFYVLRVIWVLIIHFVLSIYNDWADPRIHMYDQIRFNREALRESRRKKEQEEEEKARKEEEEKAAKEAAENQNVEEAKQEGEQEQEGQRTEAVREEEEKEAVLEAVVGDPIGAAGGLGEGGDGLDLLMNIEGDDLGEGEMKDGLLDGLQGDLVGDLPRATATEPKSPDSPVIVDVE